MAGVRIEDIEVDKNAANKLAQKLTSSDGCLRKRTMKKLRRLIEHSAGGNDGWYCLMIMSLIFAYMFTCL